MLNLFQSDSSIRYQIIFNGFLIEELFNAIKISFIFVLA